MKNSEKLENWENGVAAAAADFDEETATAREKFPRPPTRCLDAADCPQVCVDYNGLAADTVGILSAAAVTWD